MKKQTIKRIANSLRKNNQELLTVGTKTVSIVWGTSKMRLYFEIIDSQGDSKPIACIDYDKQEFTVEFVTDIFEPLLPLITYLAKFV